MSLCAFCGAPIGKSMHVHLTLRKRKKERKKEKMKERKKINGTDTIPLLMGQFLISFTTKRMILEIK